MIGVGKGEINRVGSKELDGNENLGEQGEREKITLRQSSIVALAHTVLEQVPIKRR